MCDESFSIEISFLWLSIFTPGLLYVIGYFMALPLNERVSGVKHLQMMTKLSPIMYWATCFIWDYLCFIIIVIFTMIAMFSFDVYNIFSGPNELGKFKKYKLIYSYKHNVFYITGVLFTLLLIYGWSGIFYAYVYSFFKKNLVNSMLLFISINFIIGCNLILFYSLANHVYDIIMFNYLQDCL